MVPPSATQVLPVQIPTEAALQRLKFRSSSCTWPEALIGALTCPSSAVYCGVIVSVGRSSFDLMVSMPGKCTEKTGWKAEKKTRVNGHS